ncbi:MAG: AbrB family transcriptional regulator [Pseudodesulfovibrio sp.]|uniref:AbrB family transcriptional regulator n=1 Tax=Pseudodesulfovibrio sp. TaxID=2035812 RepID=UPI003D0BB9C1
MQIRHVARGGRADCKSGPPGIDCAFPHRAARNPNNKTTAPGETTSDPVTALGTRTVQQLTQLPLILGAALLGGLLVGRLNIPGGVIIGSMLAVIALKTLSSLNLELPGNWPFLIEVAVGATVGMSFSPAILPELKHYLVPILTSALLLILLGGFLAVVFSKFWGIDLTTAFISTSPGAMTAMTGMAGGLKVDIFLVLTFHVIRVVLVILLAPALMRLCRALL